ncbi:FAD dependent oxidoreductase [Paraprevotella xylaniphila YIT 11841]|uniref:FAD dependent oxidoreductase n=1 Tax=Paraprevotella xylaniphila YIT 11841 TaxID=762982 RepID=F3QQX5_9BACT|nr:FAD-dependent oxidoreductase [Paraprevotella xylaniphila]EGG56566.1 FAD dependent oxidoreductase [Paraprevotella xylaniphila YIT 11841]
MMEQDYDVIIIGGGLLGCATAYQLAKRKVGKVLLLDANEIASQASSRAACLLTRARTKPALMEMVQETYDCIDEIEHLLGESLELQQCGSVTISSSDASLKELEALEEAAVRFGIPNERIDRRRLKELLPWMEVSAVEEALYMLTDAFIDCALLCSGYARAARVLGAELRPNTKVKAIVAVGGKATGVELADGEKILAPVVVNAAGSWANLLMRPLGIGLPFTPVRSHFWITGTNPGRFPANHPFTVIPDARAFTRSDVGALIIGLRESECQAFNPDALTDKLEDFDFNKAAEWEVLDECAPLLQRYLPDIETLGIAHYVAGPSCYVPDAKFIIGQVRPYEGLYAVAGCCGGGVAAGGGMGRLAAELILREEPFVDPSGFAPDRFGTVDPFSAEFQKRCADARSNKKGG